VRVGTSLSAYVLMACLLVSRSNPLGVVGLALSWSFLISEDRRPPTSKHMENQGSPCAPVSYTLKQSVVGAGHNIGWIPS